MDLCRYKKRAIKKKIDFNLTAEWVKEKLSLGLCVVTGIPFKTEPNNSAINPYLPSVDRVDSKKGYTEDNCQLVIVAFNNLKSNNTSKETLDFCRGFVKYYEDLLE